MHNTYTCNVHWGRDNVDGEKQLKCDNDYRKSGTFHNFSTCLTLYTGFTCGNITYFVIVIVDAAAAVCVSVIATTVLVLRYLFDSPAIVGKTQATTPIVHSASSHVGCKYCHLSRVENKIKPESERAVERKRKKWKSEQE